MNISEASAVARLLAAATNYTPDMVPPIEADELAETMTWLNARAGQALNLTGVIPRELIEPAAARIAQANADAL